MSEKHSIAAKKRLAHLTPEQKSAYMAKKVKKGRWDKMTPEQRSAHAKKMLDARYKK